MKQFLTKVRGKTLNVLRKVIYYNHKYKPKGSFVSTKEYVQAHKDSGVKYYEIFPDQVTTLEIPTDLLPILSPWSVYDTFDPTRERTLYVITNYVVSVVPKGRLYSNNIDMVAVITQDNFLLADVSFQYHMHRKARPQENKVFKQNYFIAPKKYKGVVFNMLAGGGPIINYGHWLIDVVPRIHLLKKSGWFDKVDWFVVPNYRIDFQKDTLRLLGVSADKIIIGTDQLHIEADTLISSTAPRGDRSYLMPDWVVDFHRKAYINPNIDEKKYPSMIYITRRDGKARKVLNEPELITTLESYGCKCLELRSYSFVEKVNLFNAAKVIISVTGAGLANVMYCNKSAKVIEIFPDVLIHTFNYNLAEVVGLDFYFMVCKAETGAKNLTEANDANITVDIVALKKLMDEEIFKKVDLY
ncbi:glycosyltransferase family 61 protein [Rhodocytophaga rosea]|uniref:Glycosyltransferase family 61 protein n=1 Tax=Rhodocytophaga rosea TaxID=2704465 RepID=A0A6C0GQR9_9BACT|nr:glycosyltransferase 61 family protein [Rhodocytophaga rosea]QHT70204.1 glycosyltransferase family 61 protein [Rhodocytophaga rosea]